MPSVAMLKRTHPGQWLAIEIHREDGDGVPLEGELLYHGPDADEAYSQVGRTSRVVYIVHNVPLEPSIHVGFL